LRCRADSCPHQPTKTSCGRQNSGPVLAPTDCSLSVSPIEQCNCEKDRRVSSSDTSESSTGNGTRRGDRIRPSLRSHIPLYESKRRCRKPARSTRDSLRGATSDSRAGFCVATCVAAIHSRPSPYTNDPYRALRLCCLRDRSDHATLARRSMAARVEPASWRCAVEACSHDRNDRRTLCEVFRCPRTFGH